MTTTAEELLTVADVARLTQMHPQTVYKHIWMGKLRVIRLPGSKRALRIQRSDYEDYLRRAEEKCPVALPGDRS